MLGDLAARRSQFLRDDRGGSFLMPGKFRVSVKVLVNREQRGQLRVGERLRRLLREAESAGQRIDKQYDRQRNESSFRHAERAS